MARQPPISFSVQIVVFLLAPFLILPFLLALGAIYGLVWALDISRRIVQEKAKGSYDLLRITPQGEFMVNWAICTGRAHRYQAFDRANGLGVWAGRMLFGTVLLLAFVLSSPFFITHPDRGWLQLVTLLASGVALVIHHRQSIVLGCLLGMLIPTYVDETFNARVVVFGITLLAQITTYITSWFIASLLATWITDYTLWLGLSLTAFALIRETLLFGIWRLLMSRLDIPPREAAESLDWQSPSLV